MLNAKMPDETTAMTTFHSLINEIQDTTPSGSAKRQLRALTRITDLFAAGSGAYSEQQIGLFDEVFKTLVAVIELKPGSGSPAISQPARMRQRRSFEHLPSMKPSPWRLRF